MMLKQCLEEGFLKKTAPSIKMANASLGKSEAYIDKAVSNMGIGNYDLAIVCAYTSMFHAARSVLFRDGFKERSHVCLISYLEEMYPELKSYAAQVDQYRRARHTVLYALDSVQTRADAEIAIGEARAFSKKVASMLSR